MSVCLAGACCLRWRRCAHRVNGSWLVNDSQAISWQGDQGDGGIIITLMVMMAMAMMMMELKIIIIMIVIKMITGNFYCDYH